MKLKQQNQIPQNPQVITATAELKAIPWANLQLKALLETAFLTALALVLPALLAHTPHNQWLTGTVVNALLFLAAWRVGILNAFVIAFLPSSVALMRGLLPAPMAVMIPYIILGNILLVLIFSLIKTKMLTLRVVLAAILKTAILWGAAVYLINAPKAILVMMQWPQFFTALAGGLLAVGIIKASSKKSDA